MRPERLELEGFTAFRDRVEIDFAGADLFVLVGPTGSGKSSIIDAITFALYGSIPRLRKGRVEPVISLGAQRARIRFDFSVGEARYSATRVVQRTKTGATTNEARLEGGPEEVVGASELTIAVEELLGLSYEHFTKSVVLPQGKFASFLLGGSSDRQALLRELLDLGRYARVRDLAVQRAQASEVRAESLRDSLAKLDAVTPEAVAELEATKLKLEAVIEWSAARREQLDSARARRDETMRERGRLAQLADALRSIGPPDGLGELDASMARAVAERDAAVERLEKASEALDQATAAANAAGDPGEIARLIGFVEQSEKLDARVAAGTKKIAELQGAAANAAEEAEKLAVEAVHARERLERLRNARAAHVLPSVSKPGEPCPVCRRILESDHLADDGESGSLEDAVEQVEAATRAADASTATRLKLETQLGEYRSQLSTLEAERVEAATRLGEHSRADLERKQREIAEALERRDAASRAVSEERSAVDAAAKRVSQLADRATAFWTALDKQRMAVTALEPPEVLRKDLGAEWAAFLEWRDLHTTEVEARLAAMTSDLETQSVAIDDITRAMSERIAQAGVELVAGSDPHEQALVSRARTIERLERMRSDLKDKIEAAAALEGYEGDVVVARALAAHLKVNGFERWLIEEVVHDLVVHANERLEQLSGGAYALAVEKSEFVIIDRLNADERRAPETLSGGETFVVSLALALSLADQMASISMSGTARLESVFLDEGFGTLDSETLDTVAAVIHELGSDGRTVGLITHVSELAQQIPVRFEVSKRSDGARVHRVDA